MIFKSISCLTLACLLVQEVVSQNAPIPTQPPEPEPQEGLKCWECSPIELSVSPNSHMNQLECLTNDDDYGELKTCDAFNGACAKGTIDVDGKEFTIRKCQHHAMEKVGTCEDVTHLEQDMKFCYCGTNECNGSIQLYPNSNFVSFIISTILMLLARNLV